ncbi:hypothetical protein AB0H73_36205 [Streptomyces olivoreticuli]
MALRRDIPTAPGTRPDPRYEKTYQASKGGHYKADERPVPGTPKQDGTGRSGR